MRKFCISDIHGHLNAFLEVLKDADFKFGEDHLYILGDMIDWGNQSIDVIKTVIKWQEEYPNTIFVTIGNHELLMLSSLKSNFLAMDCWENNRGMATYQAYKKLPQKEQDKIYDWLSNLPVFYEIDNYYLTHSFIYEKDANTMSMSKSLRCIHDGFDPGTILAVWTRVELDIIKEIMKDKILISGHTITSKYDNSKNPVEALFRLDLNYINIDCGAKSLGKLGRRLCLLEIDSYKTYYSEKN